MALLRTSEQLFFSAIICHQRFQSKASLVAWCPSKILHPTAPQGAQSFESIASFSGWNGGCNDLTVMVSNLFVCKVMFQSYWVLIAASLKAPSEVCLPAAFWLLGIKISSSLQGLVLTIHVSRNASNMFLFESVSYSNQHLLLQSCFNWRGPIDIITLLQL